MAEFGWDETWIGYLTAANIIGALFVLFACIGLIRRMGGVRALQVCLLLGAASLLLFHVPSLALALLASALIGLSNGAANPAGSEVLQRFTPAARRNFVFSIKQAGVPLGGVIAGLAIPPLVEALGLAHRAAARRRRRGCGDAWRCGRSSRASTSRARDAGRASHALTFADLAVPLRALSRGPGLCASRWSAPALSVAQACWFTFAVTYVVVGLGHVAERGGAGVRGDAGDQRRRPHRWSAGSPTAPAPAP